MTARKRTTRTDVADVEAQLDAIEKGSGTGEVNFARGASLHVSNLGKMYFPEAKLTKGGLMRYYTRVWPVLQPHVVDRPLVLKRFPDGVGGQMFYQQNAGANVPDIVRVEKVATAEEGPSDRMIGGDLATLLYTVQLGAIEVHPWLSRVQAVDEPDRCLIDLDPGDDVSFAAVVSLARDVRRIAKDCGLPAAVKTSGSTGIHIVIPLPSRTSYATSQALASLISEAVVAARPELATTNRSIKARPAGSIYVDAMQNARGKSMAGAYSVRPRPLATVSTPLAERELTPRLKTEGFTTRSVAARITRVGDLWGEALASRPTAKAVDRAMSALEQVLEGPSEGAPTKVPAKRATPKKSRSRAGGRSAGAGSAGKRRTRST